MSPEEMKLRELADEQIGKREELIKTITRKKKNGR